MTFSILAHDRETGVYAAAAATGNLCVGGWVLRGDIESGLVASQGTAPSTFWRDEIMRQMHGGTGAELAVERVVGPDPGRRHRQIIALDAGGCTRGFTGEDSIAFADHVCDEGLAVAGNMLTGQAVLEAMISTARNSRLAIVERMLAVLDAADAAGGDTRGLVSAALLVLDPHHPPLDLRIDCHVEPLAALKQLCDRVRGLPYRGWLDKVPVLADRTRHP
ncbi:MAG: DUF1028 domain-containing protein [Rhodobacteraceae bacterium]|nr:DUF1028 domain-containing protein [Paracoccaceae bacterium]